MKQMRVWGRRAALGCAAALLAAGWAAGQERVPAAKPQRAGLYSAEKEITLLGTVTAYTPSSKTAPMGPRVTLQTAAGSVEVHLGDARFLQANHFTIQTGDTLRIIGESVTIGGAPVMLARIVQNGPKALAVRSKSGFPLTCCASGTTAETKGGAR